MSTINNLKGQTFGRLTVIEDSGKRTKEGRVEWLCSCVCGNKITVSSHGLQSGNTKSCGCYKLDMLNLRNEKYNKYELYETYGIGYTYNTHNIFYFDIDDFNNIKNICWFESNNGYINCNQQNKSVGLHRMILKPKDNEIIDHINRNKKDNRKQNLRIVTSQQNLMNKDANKNNKIKIKGVSSRKDGKYMARITFDGHNIYLGYFDNVSDAKHAREQAELKYFGEYGYKESKGESD